MNRLQAGALSLSAAGLVAIAGYEGYSGVAYQPLPGDKPTIGFGTTEGVKAGDTTTPPKALKRLLYDSETAQAAIRKCVRVPLYQYEYDTYSSLAYNIGASAFCGSTLVKKLNSKDYAGACSEILRWKYFRGKVSRGLEARRKSEYQMCVGGQQ